MLDISHYLKNLIEDLFTKIHRIKQDPLLQFCIMIYSTKCAAWPRFSQLSDPIELLNGSQHIDLWQARKQTTPPSSNKTEFGQG